MNIKSPKSDCLFTYLLRHVFLLCPELSESKVLVNFLWNGVLKLSALF